MLHINMKTPIAIALMLAAAVPCMSARVTTPEPDSAAAINARIRADFPYTLQEFEAIAAARYPGYTPEKIRRGLEKHYIETMVIDDTLRVFRKAPRNLGLLDPALNGGWTSRNWDVEPARIAGVDSILAFYDAGHAVGPGKRVTYRFSIDVPSSPDIEGDPTQAARIPV